MKKSLKFFGIAAVAALALLATSCEKKDTAKNYTLTVNFSLPDGVSSVSGLTVEATKGSKTTTLTVEETENGYTAVATLSQGNYSISVSGTASVSSRVIGTADVSLYEDVETSITLSVVIESPLLIKAFQYSPGALYYVNGSDTWIEIVNNSDETQYLDQLIIVGGMGGQKAANAWQANGLEHLYGGASQSPVFAFPGKGTDYPLEPGKSVVLANNPKNHKVKDDGGEIVPDPDHENCADLSNADWEFYCDYNANDVDYEGIPNLECIFYSYKYQANWGQNFFCNAAMLIKLPEGVTPSQYVANEDNLMTTPGTTSDTQFLVFPNEYVLDAVDIWDADEEVHYPTFLAIDDAQGILGTGAWEGNAVRRKVAKIENGRAYYKDTNNSSKDFVSAKGGTIVPAAVPTAADAE